jgi:hypothetical protein
MSSKLSWVFAVVLALAFHLDSAVSHPLLKLWWIPMVICYLILQLGIVQQVSLSERTRLWICITSGLFALYFVLYFNDSATIYLFGSWSLITMAIIFYQTEMSRSSRRPFAVIAMLVAVSLLLLPVGINRITIKLPSLSGQTHFTVFSDLNSRTIPSAHLHQRIVNYEELELQLSAKYYPGDKEKAPLLELRNDQNGVKFVLQDVSYRHVLGLFRKTFYSVDPMDMNQLTPLTESDEADISYPGNGGIRIENLAIDDAVWLQLPGIPKDAIAGKDKAAIVATRLLFWLLIFAIIFGWRPRKSATGQVRS